MSRYVKSTVGHVRGPSKRYEQANVDVAVNRGGVPLSRLEMNEAVRKLTARRLSAADIAEHLGTTNRTVERARTRLRAAGVWV